MTVLRDMSPETRWRAVIDIGTNSVHLVVARAYGSGHFEVIGREKEAVRLGSGQGEMKRLSPAAIDRAIAAFTAVGHELGVLGPAAPAS